MDNIESFIKEAKSSNETKSGIYEKDFQYIYCKIDDNNQPQYRRLSNFTIRIIASHYRDEGIYREIIFQQANKESNRIMLAPDCMFEGFKSFLASCGNYCWWGNSIDLTNLWHYLYKRDEGKIIYEPECIGWQENHKLFMFENIAFKGSETLTPDPQGTFWIEGKGIRPRSLSPSKSETPAGLPYIITDITLDIQEVRLKLHDTMDKTMADQCLGWCCSVLYMEEIFAKYGHFPFLFISGKRGTGKSTIAQWLTYLFGFESAGRMWSDTTPVAIGRYTSYYSSLPLWLDEYRNDPKYANKNGLLRDVFNRHSAGKGTRQSFGVREDIIRGTVIVSGEETPQDNALLTRCIIIPMTKLHRRNNHFNWFSDNRRLLSNFTYQILKNKQNNKTTFMKNLNDNKEALSKLKFDDRMATNKAIVASGFELLFDKDDSFAHSLISSASEDTKSQEEESALSVFFNDVAAMLFAKSINNNYWAIKDDCIYIYFHGLYNEWAVDYRKRRGEPPFKLQSLRGYLVEEPGYLSMSVSNRMDDNSVRSCVKFQLEICPEYIKQLRK